MRIGIIPSTTRDGRRSIRIAQWAQKEMRSKDNLNTYEIIDLKEINLPFFDEKNSPYHQKYEHDHTKKWSKLIDSFDGFILVLAEYNGGYTSDIKNAIDYLYKEWQNKPFGLIGFGGSGGKNAVRQMEEVLKHMKMDVIKEKVYIKKPWDSLDGENNIDPDYIEGNITKFLNQIN